MLSQSSGNMSMGCVHTCYVVMLRQFTYAMAGVVDANRNLRSGAERRL